MCRVKIEINYRVWYIYINIFYILFISFISISGIVNILNQFISTPSSTNFGWKKWLAQEVLYSS